MSLYIALLPLAMQRHAFVNAVCNYTVTWCACVCAGLQVKSTKWSWYWWLLIAVVIDLVLATIVYGSYVCWNGRRISRERAALVQDKLSAQSTAPTGAIGKGQGTAVGGAPVQMTAAAGDVAVNPYYSKSFSPAPGLQQPVQSSYVYPGLPLQ